MASTEPPADDDQEDASRFTQSMESFMLEMHASDLRNDPMLGGDPNQN